MRASGQTGLAEVFDALVREEQGHLGNVERWIESSGTASASRQLPEPLFDNEGAALVAPELLDAYRAFAMAVRNEERAFVFWTYVSAHAASQDIRSASERMAREELGHVATLRRERRRAFHALRATREASRIDVASLEDQLADELERVAAAQDMKEHGALQEFAQKARVRARLAETRLPAGTRLLREMPPAASGQLAARAEWLLDLYLDLAERDHSEELQLYTQTCAADLIGCLHHVRQRSASVPS